MADGLSIADLRLTLRLTNAFMLEAFRLFRSGRDFTDGLILTALHSETPRAISINAVAGSLGLPFETVRRRVRALERDGVCEAAEAGVRLSDPFIASAAYEAMTDGVTLATERFHTRLAAASCLPSTATGTSGVGRQPGDVQPIVRRAVAEYILRLMELLLPNFESPSLGLLILTVAWANTRGLADSLRGDDGVQPAAYISDDLRRPVRVNELSALLGMPYETTRRNLGALVADGRCRKVGRGYIVPAEVMARPRPINALSANMTNLGRLMGALAEAGVLTCWTGQGEAPARERPAG